jgi:predicted transposase YdaD
MGHDELFKQLLRTFFVEFLELFLPEVAQYFERGSETFVEQEVLTDLTAAERHEVDLLVKARFRGSDAFFLVHVENQASRQQAFARRMFRYFARLHDKYDLPVYPVAVFSYDRPRRAEPDRYEVAFPDRVVMSFTFREIQLNRLNWRDYLRQPNPVAAALMTRMQIAPEDRPRVKLECLRLLATLRLDAARTQLIKGFLDRYLALNAQEVATLHSQFQALEPPVREAVMRVTNEWEELGAARGRQEGRQQGRQEGQAQLVLRLLRRRFGAVPEQLESQIRALPTEKSEDLGEALLDFSQLAQVQAWLSTNA